MPAKSPVTGRLVVCPASGTSIHVQPVALPVRRDRKGGFYGVCFCGARFFLSKMWTERMGYTPEEADGLGFLVTWRPGP